MKVKKHSYTRLYTAEPLKDTLNNPTEILFSKRKLVELNNAVGTLENEKKEERFFPSIKNNESSFLIVTMYKHIKCFAFPTRCQKNKVLAPNPTFPTFFVPSI